MGGIKRESFFQEITAPISADVSVIWCVTSEENVFVRKREVMRGWSHMTTSPSRHCRGCSTGLAPPGALGEAEFNHLRPQLMPDAAGSISPQSPLLIPSACASVLWIPTHRSHTNCPTQESRLESKILKVIFFIWKPLGLIITLLLLCFISNNKFWWQASQKIKTAQCVTHRYWELQF